MARIDLLIKITKMRTLEYADYPAHYPRLVSVSFAPALSSVITVKFG